MTQNLLRSFPLLLSFLIASPFLYAQQLATLNVTVTDPTGKSCRMHTSRSAIQAPAWFAIKRPTVRVLRCSPRSLPGTIVSQ
jgi:hypothetical protein